MAADHFCLRWNNYQSNMVSELDSLRSDEDLVDVTLSCEGHLLKAHKVILSACSSYFRNVFKDNPCKHPVVILKDVSYEDVEALLSFVYQGVVYISEKQLASFLQTAELLQIRGLTGAATTMKDASHSETTAIQSQNKVGEKNNVPPPPQLLTANLINSWKQQGVLNATSTTIKSPVSNPSSPSLPVVVKRRKCVPSKMTVKENFECSDTNSNPDYSENESDTPTVKQEILDRGIRPEVECISIEDVSREESSREGNPSFYENMMESDDESVDSKNREATNSEKLSGNPNASCSNLYNMAATYCASQSPNMDQNSSASGSHLAQCGNCPHCGQTYSNQSALKYHVRLMHCDLTNQFSCYLCPMSFVHRDDYKAHMWEVHKVRSDTRLGRRPCPLCQKIISNKSNLLKHMRIRHSDEHNPAGCTICNKVFKNKYSLRAHINIYHKEMSPSNLPLSSTTHPHGISEYNIPQHQSNASVNNSDYCVSTNHLYSTNSNNYVVSSSVDGNDLTSYQQLVKEHAMNRFNVSNLPLT